MKKVLYILLFIMLIPLTVHALDNKTINATVGNVAQNDVVDIEVSWDKMEFIYIVENNYVWNAATHKYTKEVNGYWVNTGNKITVKNNSAKSVVLNAKYENHINSITGSFSTPNFTVNGHSQKSISFNLNGTLSSNYYRQTNAGIITLDIK